MDPWLALYLLVPILFASFGLFAGPRRRAVLFALAIVAIPLAVSLRANLARLPQLLEGQGLPPLSTVNLASKLGTILGAGALPALVAWGLIWRAPEHSECPRIPLRPVAKARRGAALTLLLVALLGLGLGIIEPFQTTREVARDLWSNVTPWLLVGLSLGAALTEELLFRGVVYAAAASVTGFVAGGIAQGLLFGFVHAGYGDPLYVAAAAAFGLIQAYVSVRWGILVAVMVHAQVNLLVLGWASQAVSQVNATLAVAVLAFNLLLVIPAGVACLTSRHAQCPIDPDLEGADELPGR